MFLPQLIVSLVFLASGLLMVKFPPAKINPIYGYRTRRSMQSPEAWRYAQRVASRKMVLVGAVGLMLFSIGCIGGATNDVAVFVLVATVLGALVYVVYSVESSLKRKFPIDRV